MFRFCSGFQVAPIKTRDVSRTLMSIASGGNSQLGKLLQVDKIEEAAQVAYAVLSMAENMNERNKAS